MLTSRALFNRFDRNNDKRLTRNEFRRAVRQNPNFATTARQIGFKGFDTNNSNSVGIREFRRTLRQFQNSQTANVRPDKKTQRLSLLA